MTKQTLQRREPSASASSRAPSAFAPRGFGDTLSRLPAPTPQAKLTVNQPGDKYEQEADAVADRVLRMGETAPAQRAGAEEEEEAVQAKPLAGAISPLVQREGDGEEEDEEDRKPVQAKALPGASGLLQRDPAPDEEDPSQTQASAPAPDAAKAHSEAQTPKAAGQEPDEELQAQRKESGDAHTADVSGVVSQGLSGGGQPLDDSTRAFMEPRFGHDFSQVRIHTDSRASQSSEQIAARAYTVGSDIAFRSGEFSPGSSDGRRLLAHELTHVVQQNGTTARSSQRSLGQAYRSKRLADNTADSMTAAQTQLSAPGIPTVQAAYDHKTPNWGTMPMIARKHPSEVNFDGTFKLTYQDEEDFVDNKPFNEHEGLQNVRPKSKGTFVFHFISDWDLNNLTLNDEGGARYSASIAFSVSEEGQITWASPEPGESEVNGSGATLLVPVPMTTNATPTEGSVVAAPTVSYSASATSGGAAGVGPISVSVPYSSTNNEASSLMQKYKVNLRVLKKPELPISLDPPLRFKVNSASLEDGQEGAFSQWFLGQPVEVRNAVNQGKRAIEIKAFASTTGKRHKNRLLSQQRATTAQFILRGFAGPGAAVNPFYFGEDTARTPDEKEDPKERRTEVSILPSGQAAAPVAGGK